MTLAAMKITWLASYAKSGNTWVRLFLSRLLVGDGWDINCVAARIPYLLEFAKPPRPYSAADLGDAGVVSGVAASWLPLQAEIRRRLDPESAARATLIKTHNANVCVAGYPFTCAEHSDRALHLIRDPRDVAVSLAHHLDFSLERVVGMMMNPNAIVIPDDGLMPEVWSDWATHSRSWRSFPDGPVMTLRYEDLSQDPATHFQRVLDFLGWSFDAGAVDAALDAVSFGRLQSIEERDGFVEAPRGRVFFRRGVAGGWRDHPEHDLFRRLEDAFAEEMTVLGYR